MKPKKFPTKIITKRLILKPAEPSFKFAQMIFDEINSNRDYYKFLDNLVLVKRPEEEYEWAVRSKENFLSGKKVQYVMWTRKTNELVGAVGIFDISFKNEHCEFGAWVAKKFAKQGFASECLQALEKLCFEMGFHKLKACADKDNKASCATIKKLGFTKDGVERDCHFSVYLNSWRTDVNFSKLVSEYKRKK